MDKPLGVTVEIRTGARKNRRCSRHLDLALVQSIGRLTVAVVILASLVATVVGGPVLLAWLLQVLR